MGPEVLDQAEAVDDEVAHEHHREDAVQHARRPHAAKGDPVVPYAQGRGLFELAPGPKELWTLESSGHTEALFAQGADYRPRLLAWLKKALSAPG